MNKETKQVAIVAGVAAGVAALTAAGYFMLGPNGKKNQKQLKGWAIKMKGDVVEKLEKLQNVTPEVYNTIIDEVSLKYGKLKSISAEELADIATDLKKHWRAISRDLKSHELKIKLATGVSKKVETKKVAATKKAVKKAVTTTTKAVKTAVKEVKSA